MKPSVKDQSGFPACIHLSLEFNPHAVLYESLTDWLRDSEDRGFEWVNDGERAKAIAADSIWICQWYPATPVGFCLVAAASFEALMTAINARAVNR